MQIKQNSKFLQYIKNLSTTLKKKIILCQITRNFILKLKKVYTIYAKKLSFLIKNSVLLKNIKKQSFGIIYIIHLNFSPINTFLFITDSFGILKYKYSAGSLAFKGKQKRNKAIILKSFYKELTKLKIVHALKNKVIALHLTNIGFLKYFIIKKLKNIFFIKFVKNYQTYARNGCKKKKQLRKK